MEYLHGVCSYSYPFCMAQQLSLHSFMERAHVTLLLLILHIISFHSFVMHSCFILIHCIICFSYIHVSYIHVSYIISFHSFVMHSCFILIHYIIHVSYIHHPVSIISQLIYIVYLTYSPPFYHQSKHSHSIQQYIHDIRKHSTLDKTKVYIVSKTISVLHKQ